MIEIFKKEEWLPYVLVGFIVAQAILILLSLILGFGTGGIGTFFILKMQQWPYSTELVLSIVINIIVIFGSVFLLVRALTHDRALRTQKKDEREILHDQMVSSRSYKIAVLVFTGYAVLLADPVILIVLIIILTLRLLDRARLERGS